MCYAIPGKIEQIRDKVVTVDYFGQKKTAINELHNLVLGDYIYAQGGYVLQKIAAPDAAKILSAWKDVFVQLRKVDKRISRLDPVKLDTNARLKLILDKVGKAKPLSNPELRFLLALKSPAEMDLVFKEANFLRQKYHQNACCVHGIIEISNHCVRNCAYCGISSHNARLPHYRMTREEILAAVQEAVEQHGFKALVLQSGEDPGYTIDELAEIIIEIKKRHAVLIVISFGEIQESGLRKLFSAGARGLLMRFETSNPQMYRKLHPSYTLETRLAHIRKAYQLGYLIFTGGLIGLPGQTDQDIVNDLLLTRQLNAEMVSFGPFLPHPATPLAKSAVPQESLVLKTLALARFVMKPDAKIVVTTAFETLTPLARQKGLLAGANSVMINCTPLKYRSNYTVYPKRAHDTQSITVQARETIRLLKSLGRVPMDVGTQDLRLLREGV